MIHLNISGNDFLKFYSRKQTMIQSTITRRDFLKISAIAGSALALGGLIQNAGSPKLREFQETRLLMGTIINISLISDNPTLAGQAIQKTFAQLETLVKLLDHRREDGPVGILNASGKLANPSEKLVELLELACRFSQLTDGAFDVTIKPLVDLYRSSKAQGLGLPGAEALKNTAALVDYRQIEIGKDEIKFSNPGVQITLDGIAKGYIVDHGVAVLRELGFVNAMVEAGGDLLAAGNNSSSTPWRIGIQSPRNARPGLLAKIELTNQSAATSGDYMDAFTKDLSHHHIIDPRTGVSAPFLASATVIGQNTMQADALATSLMVLKPTVGLTLVENFSGVEAYLVTKDLVVLKSAGFPEE
jgi:thiamine biosynthesis lipoprotein